MSGFRKPSRACPDNRLRLTTVEIGLDEAWQRFALSDPADRDYADTLALGELVLRDARQVVGEYGFTAVDYVDAVRELYRAGRLGFAEDGGLYFGHPIRDALGRLTGVRPFTDEEAAEDQAQLEREWSRTTGVGDAE